MAALPAEQPVEPPEPELEPLRVSGIDIRTDPEVPEGEVWIETLDELQDVPEATLTAHGDKWTRIRSKVWGDWGSWNITANTTTPVTYNLQRMEYTVGTGDTAWTMTDEDYTRLYTGYANRYQQPTWRRWGNFTWTETASTTNTIRFETDYRQQYAAYTYANTAVLNPRQAGVWDTWNRGGIYTTERTRLEGYDPYRDETPEEREARLDREQIAREEASRRRLAEAERVRGARDRAEELLAMVLSGEEKAMREQQGHVVVRGSGGGLYEVRMTGGVHGNITEIDEHGCRLGNLCVQPRMYDEETGKAIPEADGWVGQILGLKFNEGEFVAKANRSLVRECRHPGIPILGQRVA